MVVAMSEEYKKKVPTKIGIYQENVQTLADEFTKALQIYSNGDRNVSRNSDEVYSNFMAISANLENVKRSLVKNFRELMENESLFNVLEKHTKEEHNSLENLVFTEEGNIEWIGNCVEPEFVKELKTVVSSTYQKNEELENQIRNYEDENKKLKEQNREYEIKKNHLNFELDGLRSEKEGLDEMIKNYEGEIKELKKQNESLREQNKEYEKGTEHLNFELDGLRSEKEGLDEMIKNYEVQIEELKKQNIEYESELGVIKDKYEEAEKLLDESEAEYQKVAKQLKGQISINKNTSMQSKTKSSKNENDFDEIVDSATKDELFSIYRKINKDKSSMNLDERTIKLGEMLGDITLDYRRLKQEYEQTLEKLEQTSATRDELYKQRSKVLNSHRNLARKNKNLEDEIQIAKSSVENLQDELENYKRRLEGSNRLIVENEGLLDLQRKRAHKAELNYDEALHENIELSEKISSMGEYINNLESSYKKLSHNHAKILSKLDDTENFLEATNKKAQQVNLVSALKDILAKKLGQDLNHKQVVLENTYNSLESAQEKVRQKEQEAEIIEAEYTEILREKDRELKKKVAYVKALEAGQKNVMDRLKKLEKPLKTQVRSLEIKGD